MSLYSETGRTGSFRERPKYPGLGVLFLVLFWALPLSVARAQSPEGTFVAVGPAFVPGMGLTLGHIGAGRFVSKEVVLAAGYRSSRDGSIRTSATVGGAIRLLNARRTVLAEADSGLDVDIGLRIGPAVLFRFEESTIDRNKRFTLVADPFLRVGYRRGATFFLEAGIHRPAFRGGFWIPIGTRP